MKRFETDFKKNSRDIIHTSSSLIGHGEPVRKELCMSAMYSLSAALKHFLDQKKGEFTDFNGLEG